MHNPYRTSEKDSMLEILVKTALLPGYIPVATYQFFRAGTITKKQGFGLGLATSLYIGVMYFQEDIINYFQKASNP